MGGISMKRFLIAVLLIFAVTFSAFSVYAEDMSDSHIAYEELLTAWSSDGFDMYPDYVGGVYFDDSSILVVALSDNTEENQQKVLSKTSAPDGIRFENAEYNYNTLSETLSEINDKADTDGYDFSIQSVSINEEANRIEVSTNEDDFAAASALFSSTFGNKVTVIVESEFDQLSDDIINDFDDEPADDFAGDYPEEDAGNTENYNEDAFFAFSSLTSVWVEAGYTMYPPYVGGVYFADNGNLVIALCEDNESNRNAVLAASGSPDVIEFKTVKYSYDELYSIQEEIGENYNNNAYNFLVNFYSVSEEENIVEIRVASSELDYAKQYFNSLYGDKVVVLGGYDTEEDTGLEDSLNDGASLSEKLRSTSSLRLYISIAIIALAILAVLAITFMPGILGKQSSPPARRYRK